MSQHKLELFDMKKALHERRKIEVACSYSHGVSDKSLIAIYTFRRGTVGWLVMNGDKEESFETCYQAMERYNELP